MKERLAQLRAAFVATKEADDKLVPVVAGAVALTFLVVLGLLGLLAGRWILGTLSAILLASLVGLIVFGRRSQRAQLSMIEGQPGAAAAVLQSLRGQWFVTPAVAFNKKQDLVHRVVGRPGVVLVAEGDSPARVKALLAQEQKKVSRVLGDTPLHTIRVGHGEDATSLQKLSFTMTKLPRALSKTEVPKLERKLAPLDRGMPIPQGYMPRPGKKQR
ncbi:MAG: DUF4191 domain-containing protein [Actinobacteria bacterium]|nr:DUF4191 domain-containing protein [Actinomycetota bacterium]